MPTYKSNMLQYLNHTMNTSPGKTTYTFQKTPRFVQKKSYSPNKYYDLPNTRSKRQTNIGFTQKKQQPKNIDVGPGKYEVKRLFQQKKGFSFGIGRQQYYKHQQAIKKLIPPVGRYKIVSQQMPKFNIGRRLKTTYQTITPGPKYNVTESMERLSTHVKRRSARIQTQYFKKDPFYYYDNKNPGPGAYDLSLQKIKVSISNIKESNGTTFGKSQKLKKIIHPYNNGPGSYISFSAFGNNDANN